MTEGFVQIEIFKLIQSYDKLASNPFMPIMEEQRIKGFLVDLHKLEETLVTGINEKFTDILKRIEDHHPMNPDMTIDQAIEDIVDLKKKLMGELARQRRLS